ncbi:MAG: DUF2071 domain-containing protein [Chloroflexaceae bacterium]
MLNLPAVRGVIARRILVNYRVDPDVPARLLPAPFRPKCVNGVAIAGICLIRLAQIRPRFVPPIVGLASENAAHRIAVEWDDQGTRREGVYIPRRDTSSRLSVLAGGTLFPGRHHHARFSVHEQDERYAVALQSDDGATCVTVAARVSADLPAGSVFGSLPAASDFFASGSLGYSATPQPGRYEGLELRSLTWQVTPLEVQAVQSSFFEDPAHFPAGSVAFDCALLMRDIVHEWHARAALCVESPVAA